MPKKAVKGEAPDTPEVIKFKSKRVEDVLKGNYSELDLPFDAKMTKILHTFYDSQGWEYTNCPEVTKKSLQLVVRGEKDSKGEEMVSTQAIKAVGKTLKAVCPLHCSIEAVCMWHAPVKDEGLKGLLEFVRKMKHGITWAGLTHLELTDCAIGFSACETLGDTLSHRIPLKALILDFNPLTDVGIVPIAKGLRKNVTLEVLRLAYCGLTSAAGEALALGMVRGSRLKVLDVHGNQLGRHVTSEGHRLEGFGLMHVIHALENLKIWSGDPAPEGSPLPVLPLARSPMEKATDSLSPDSVESLLVKYKCVPVPDSEPGTYKACDGEWEGSTLFFGTTELGTTLHARTETLEKLDISDNSVQSNDMAKANLDLACDLQEGNEVHVRQTAVEIGRAALFENCYCALDAEIVQIERVLVEACCAMPLDVDSGEQSINIGEVALEALSPRVGCVLSVGSELMRVLSFRGTTIVVSRGDNGTEASRHVQGAMVTKLCVVNVLRGCLGTENKAHKSGTVMSRISQTETLCRVLPRLQTLKELAMDGNDIGQDAAILLLPATRGLAIFTCTGRGISEEMFKVLYKDGTSAKKKGKKKK